MLTPFVASRVAALHRDDLLAEADYARRVAQTRSTSSLSVQKESPIQTLTPLALSFVLHPRAATALAVALALLASVVLGGDGALAGANLCQGRFIIVGGRC